MQFGQIFRDRSKRKHIRSRRVVSRRLAVGFEQLDARRVLASITGVVYSDLDESGVQESGEPGLSQRVVYLDHNFDGALSIGEPYQLTGEDGRFSFSDLSPTDTSYRVRMFDGTGTQHPIAPDNGYHSVTLPTQESTAEVAFGIRISGTNSAPTSRNVQLETAQDRSFIILPAHGLVRRHGSDTGGQQFVALQMSASENGELTINTAGGIAYQSADGFAGQDSATYVLHDGRDASDPLTLTLTVVPDDQTVREIVLEGDPLPENSPADTVVGTIRMLAPGMQFIDEFAVFDPRFRVENNLLILADPFAVNFEMEPVMRVFVHAINEPQAEELLQWELEIPVADVDDPVTAVLGPGLVGVMERQLGATLGLVQVEDEDTLTIHTVEVSDERFEVVDGALKLRDDEALEYPQDNGLVLTVFVNDPANGGSTVSDLVTVTVENVNDPPTSINVSGSIRELTLGAVVGNVTVIDPDPDDTYSITVDDSRFEVVDGVLKLRDDQSVVYSDAEPSITLQLTATQSNELDGTISAEIVVPIIESPSPWQNLPESLDVNNDGQITPQDALIILNELNSRGPGPLPVPFDGTIFIDVNGDGLLTPLDALIIVNELNSIRSLRNLPGGDFPPIGEAEQPALGTTQPEGEQFAESPDERTPTGTSPNMFRQQHPSAPQPLYAATTNDGEDEVFNELEDWLAPELHVGV